MGWSRLVDLCERFRCQQVAVAAVDELPDARYDVGFGAAALSDNDQSDAYATGKYCHAG